MVKIEHIGIYTKDLERLREFYEKYFGAKSNNKYTNSRGFSSYFLTFDEGARMEIMTYPVLADGTHEEYITGVVHFAISLGSKENVFSLTERLRGDGYNVIRETRNTGDGYFESVIADPDGNAVELTI